MIEQYQILAYADMYGKERLDDILSVFSSPKNEKASQFLKNNAYDFARKKISVTHLIIRDSETVLGYYTLALKEVTIREEGLSHTVCKKLSRYGKYDPSGKIYRIPAYLIAWIAKNSSAADHSVDGSSIICAALDTIVEGQFRFGGGLVYLECEKEEKLVSFYKKNGFSICGARKADDGDALYVMLKFV